MFRRGFPGKIRPPALDRSDSVEGMGKGVGVEGRDSANAEMGTRRRPVDWQRVDFADGVNLGGIEAVPSLSRAEAIAGQQGLAVPGVDVSRETHRCQHHRPAFPKLVEIDVGSRR